MLTDSYAPVLLKVPGIQPSLVPDHSVYWISMLFLKLLVKAEDETVHKTRLFRPRRFETPVYLNKSRDLELSL